ncbi:MAG: hypothetical protein ACTH5B_15930 [Marinomonas sp.]|uniref:hypothetical protein n=1 Tax=Marinomonas sp. TaxID=1904862 RepID=UPI00329E2150
MANTHTVRAAAQNALNQPVAVSEYKEYLMEVIALASANLSEIKSPEYATAYLSGIQCMIEKPLEQGAA